MGDTRCCGPLCQHPGCWISERMEMMEAVKRFAHVDASNNYKSLQTHEERKIVNRTEEPLPTLKVVNLFESEENLGYQNSLGDFVIHNPLQASPAAIRSSKYPSSPCATPFHSNTSHYFFKKKSPTQHPECNVIKRKIDPKSQTACITIQEIDNDKAKQEATCIPYLIWVPSKKIKRNQQKDAPATVERIHKKNITGNNADFGFLVTPFNKNGSVKCHSRATHNLRSSPTKLHPRRLPPMSREATKELSPSKDFHLSGDGVFMSVRKTPSLGTPQNTRASIFTGGKPEEWDPECSERQEDVAKQEYSNDLPGINKEGLNENNLDAQLIDHNDTAKCTVNDKKTVRKTARENKVVKEERAKLMLPRVAVPKVKLKKLTIENHCRNSVPSRQLSDIQMQPIYSTESSISSHSTESKTEMVDKVDLDDCVEKESQISNEHVVNFYEDDADHDIASKEELISNRDCGHRQEFPSTSVFQPEHADNIVYGDMEIIDFIKQEQERAFIADLCRVRSRSFASLSGRDIRASKMASFIASPAPSKSSSDDWSIDKDIMRQTYELYRSFTPFNTPGISLEDAKLASIKEASREHTLLTAREKSLVSSRKCLLRCHMTDLSPDYLSVESGTINIIRNYPKRIPTQFPSHMRSVLFQRKYQAENVSEINVSTITPRERSIKSKLNHGHTIKPVRSKQLPLEVTASNLNNEYISPHEIYEALVTTQNESGCYDELGPVIIPALNQAAKEKQDFEEDSKSVRNISDNDMKNLDICQIDGNEGDAHNEPDGVAEEKVNVISCDTDGDIEGGDASQQSQVLSDQLSSIDLSEKSDETLIINSNRDILPKSSDNKHRIYSNNEDYYESDESNTEEVILREEGGFYSFNSQINLTLDLDLIKDELDKY